MGEERGGVRRRAREFSKPKLNYHFAYLNFVKSVIEIGCLIGRRINSKLFLKFNTNLCS